VRDGYKIGGFKKSWATECKKNGLEGTLVHDLRPVNILVYVDDVDSLVKRATADGAKLLRPVTDQFYGDRVGVLEDPFGHRWSFATHIEDVSPEEMQKRAAAQHGT